MSKIPVVFQRYDGVSEQAIDVSLELKVGESCEAAQMLLALPETLPCRLVLERTGETLRDSATLGEAGIQKDDVLILISPTASPEKSETSSSSLNSSSPALATSVSHAKGFSASSPTAPKVAYTLRLTVQGAQESWDYSIYLGDLYENNPDRFFTDFHGRERQKFEDELQDFLLREIESTEIDNILQKWCDDISVGYRNSEIEI